MAALFSFYQRNFGEGNHIPSNEQNEANDIELQQSPDPWNLGVSTSTSTADTIGLQSSSDDTLLSKRTPPTPEGLRPRKSIQRIRTDLLGFNHHIHRTNLWHNAPFIVETKNRASEINPNDSYEMPIRKSIPSLGMHAGLKILPSSSVRTDGYSVHSTSSFYEQSMEESNKLSDEDIDINSTMGDSKFSRQSRRSFSSHQVAESPNLKRGGKPKTAVGALLVAMAETSVAPKKTTNPEEDRHKAGSHNKRYHRILPPRDWINDHHIRDEFRFNGHMDEEDTIQDIAIQDADINDAYYDDNQSSLHASPSSLKRHNFSRYWIDDHCIEDQYHLDGYMNESEYFCEGSKQIGSSNDAYYDDNQSSLHASPSSLKRDFLPNFCIDRQQKILQDSSFTRKILNDDPSSSRLEERSILDHSPYDFNPISHEDIRSAHEDIRSDLKPESINAPLLLSLVEDNGRLNLSAISNSCHQKGIESNNTSMADTIDDGEEEYREIPMYYQALSDDAHGRKIVDDDLFVPAKNRNQSWEKEGLLRCTFERLQNCLDLLKEVYSQSPRNNSFFLGLGKTKAATEYCVDMQVLLSNSNEEDYQGTQRQALLFFISILRNVTTLCNNAADLRSNFEGPFPTSLSNPRWVPQPGFRSLIGLKEEPQSPLTLRGEDSSLFTNDNTPHTSNVSMTTTITTVVSPDKYNSGTYKNQLQGSDSTQTDQNINIHGIRNTVYFLVCLLYRLEKIWHDFKSKSIKQSKLVESIENIYLELLDVSSADLRVIVNSFEMKYTESGKLIRTISNDNYEDVPRASISVPADSRMIGKTIQDSIEQPSNTSLHVNIMQYDDDDIDSDNRNQSVECDLCIPTTNEIMSLKSPQSEEENADVTNNGYAELVDEEPVDDLRRTNGSFEHRDVEDERESASSFDEHDRDHSGSFPATFARRVVAHRSRKARFWKKRYLALKNRGRQVTAE